ncbi:unnamed protein product, partial [Sphenostylis stenocarpa]
ARKHLKIYITYLLANKRMKWRMSNHLNELPFEHILMKIHMKDIINGLGPRGDIYDKEGGCQPVIPADWGTGRDVNPSQKLENYVEKEVARVWRRSVKHFIGKRGETWKKVVAWHPSPTKLDDTD